MRLYRPTRTAAATACLALAALASPTTAAFAAQQAKNPVTPAVPSARTAPAHGSAAPSARSTGVGAATDADADTGYGPDWTSADAERFWTPQRMAAAVPEQPGTDPAPAGPSSAQAAPHAVPHSAAPHRAAPHAAAPHVAVPHVAAPHTVRPHEPTAVPRGQHFAGTPSVGTLYYLGKDQVAHNCTASVVKSPRKNLVLTAGHCNPGPGGHSAFVPGYDQDKQPYGVWAITRGYALPGHSTSGTGSNLDFAFGVVADRDGRKLEDVTGANTLTRTPGYANSSVTVIGYPERGHDQQDQAIRCTVPTTRLPGAGLTQLQMACDGYWDGVSGGPWMLHFNGTTGDIIGNVGGLNGGGLASSADPHYDRYSYSPVYDDRIFDLYKQATTDTGPPPPPPAYSMGGRGTWQHARHVVAGDFTGHGRAADMITVWSDGEVTLYHGDGNGHFTGETQLLAPNSTWTHVVSVTAGPFTSGSNGYDLVVRWSDGELTLYTAVGAAGIGGEVQLAAPNSVWTHSAVVAGRFGNNGTTSAALVVAWDDGHVSEFPQITSHSLAGEVQMIAANSTWTHVRDITAGDLAGNNGYDLVVRWSDGELTLYPDVDTAGTHTEVQLAAPNPTWQTLTDFTVGNDTSNGWPDDLITVWADGHVTMYQDTGNKGLGAAVTLVS